MLLLAGLFTAGCEVPERLKVETEFPEFREVEPSTGCSYWEYVPSCYSHEKVYPLVVSCHGTRPFDVAQHHIQEWKKLAEINGLIVVAPELVGTDGVFGHGPEWAMLENERRILGIISHLGYRYLVDRDRMGITGFSGGGYPAYWVGLRHPKLFSALAARSCNFNARSLEGWIPLAAGEVPVLVYWGENDPGPIRHQSRAAVQWLTKMGLPVTAAVIPELGHERYPEAALAFFMRCWQRPVSTDAVAADWSPGGSDPEQTVMFEDEGDDQSIEDRGALGYEEG